ncbi:MAG TPA: AAA family ATPase [Solirubrobacteraceae bacterium]|nr:AAA family ATPase [Solirubrobacteraceae bacterium]
MSATLAPPALPSGYIPRPHLVGRLQDDCEVSTVVLTAPAGYGKSSLLCEWAAHESRPFAWLRLSPREDAPGRLLACISDALHGLEASGQVAEPADARGPTPGDGTERDPGGTSALIELAERSAANAGDFVLVLDDAHHLRSPESRELLAALADGLPQGVRMALASRSEPPLRVGRLRAAHRLLQLDPVALAMTAYEAHLLLAAVDIELDERSLERLVERTEGWPAGIYLAGLSLNERADAGEHDAHPTGDDHLVAEYLREEALAPLDDGSRALLTRASILDELSGELCDAVLEVSGSGKMLRELSADTLLLIPQDPGHAWYRCHTLLRDVLRSELEICEPAEVPRLHARASEWFAAHGEIDRAVEHAVAARDAARAGRLLWDEGSRFLYGSDERVQRWLSSFTAEELARSAPLALAAAHSHLAVGDLPTARHWASLASEALEAGADAKQAPSLQAGILLIEAATGSGGIEHVAAAAERARPLLGDASFLRPVCCLLGGVAQHLLGERERARELLGEGIDACARTMPLVEALSITQLALLDIEDGDWEQAQDGAARAVACLELAGLEDRPAATLTLALSSLVLSHRGLADEAKRELTSATRLLEALGEYMPWYEVETRIAMARASTRLADVARARTLLSQASRWARRPRPVPCFVAWLDDAWGEIDEVSAAALNGPGALTMAELRVLRFLPTHLSFREIGERLHVSGNTVKSQAHAVYAKLGAGSRTEAVAHAAALGLIDPPVV